MAAVDPRQYWDGKLQAYAQKSWARQPSLFAQEVLKYLPAGGSLLELGSGVGQDGVWFADNNWQVTQTDFVLSLQAIASDKVTRQEVDMTRPLPFAKETYDVVYAHLSLHYFALDRTRALFKEIFTILKPNGIFAFLVNSIHDPEIGEGKMLEPNYYELDGIRKRYFDMSLTRELTAEYEGLLLDEDGTSYKDREEGLLHLIRFIGKKPGE